MPARNTIWKIGAALAILLVLNGAYLWAFKSATLVYMSNVLMHVVWGIILLPFAVVLLRRDRRAWLPSLLFLLSGAIGIYLMVHGNLRVDRPVLYAHTVAA